MAKIQVLDRAVAELIAAGEVVERPASIVKELVENAIDAGADAVTVEIEDGGVSLIRVSDNGCGIAAEDIPKAFLRHATSKIASADDLDSIFTLGFRGEALASIAAMCRVEILTKTGACPEGALCRAEGGRIFAPEPAGCPEGTVITVRDVFYNTPARMKFLKKNTSEGAAVAQVVDKCALSHPEIAFKFRREGKVTLQTSGNGELLAVIRAIYGRELASVMLPVDHTADGISVRGYISAPEGAKPSRAYQTFFINGRFVRTKTAMAALEQAYKNRLMAGKFPACVLDIGLDAHSVDVNVHPAKTEVRFSEERPVFQAVYFAVKTTLFRLEQATEASVDHLPGHRSMPVALFSAPADDGDPQRMTAGEFQVLFGGGEARSDFSRQLTLRAPAARNARPDIYVETQRVPQNMRESARSDEILPKPSPTIEEWPGEDTIREDSVSPRGSRFIGELMGTYILLDAGDSLVLVDKHAAHERILYEKLLKNLRYGNKQVLLSPQPVTLSPEEHGAVLENLNTLDAMGFGVEDFGGSAVLVREVPVELGEGDIPYVMAELADKLRRGLADLTPHALDRLYYSIACRSAVKAGDKNPDLALERIVSLLEENPDITHCPHGRPVSVRLDRQAIEKLFGRLG